ncbi:hypothetical protein [Streptomyces thermoalcalitolerans]|uniref:GAF domain-containing protein n=1 Tax=Streptomyces thermoalcalitolerans TaxID=65605 RepID=A0ABN1NHA7_9ACTN
MTRPTPPNEEHETEDAVQVAGRERQLAVAHWLLSAARDRDAARREWLLQGAALLACGGIFAAVRLPGDLVRAAAQTSDEAEVNGFLRHALDGGPVIHSRYADHYYALVPGSTAWRRPPRAFPGLECLGRDCFLGVPAVDRTEPKGRAYWAVPMDSPGELCDPRLVWAMVQLAQERHQAVEAAGAADERT